MTFVGYAGSMLWRQIQTIVSLLSSKIADSCFRKV